MIQAKFRTVRPLLASSLLPLALSIASAPAWADGQSHDAAMSGFYAGINLGYGGGQDAVTEINGPRFYFPDTRGVIAGAQVGWQKQLDDRLVGGFEVEVGDLGQSGNTARSDGFATVSSSIDLGAYATFSGRLGVLVERDWLLYGRAGITVAELDARVTETATPSRSSTQDSTWGYTFGAGVERALSPQWSVRVEYQYTDFRTELALPDNGGPGPGWNHDADLHAIKLGLNMHF